MNKVYTSKIKMHYVLEWLQDNSSAARPVTPLQVAEGLILPDGRRWLDTMKSPASASGTLLNIVDVGGMHSSRKNPTLTNLNLRKRRPDIYEMCKRVRRRREDSGSFVYWMENTNA